MAGKEIRDRGRRQRFDGPDSSDRGSECRADFFVLHRLMNLERVRHGGHSLCHMRNRVITRPETGPSIWSDDYSGNRAGKPG